MQWTPVWHQAITQSLFNGKPFKKNKTVVFKVHVPVEAESLRIRFSNLYGKEDYQIGSVTVRVNDEFVPVTLNGRKNFVINRNSKPYSDEISLKANRSDVEIRIHYLNEIQDCNMIEAEANWLDGDETYSLNITDKVRKPILAKVLGSYNAIPAMDLIEVRTSETVRSIVAFGDSITAMNRWCKPLAKRLEKEYDGKYVLLNSGISGNCLLHVTDNIFSPVFGRKGVERFEDDVLSIPGLSAVIMALGVNDVSYLNENTRNEISLENYAEAISNMVNVLHERNIRVTIQTITPRLKVSRTMGVFTEEMEKLRLEINEWIRSAGIFDYVIDQEEVVRDKDDKGYFFKEGLHQGDHLHPNVEGGIIMAQAYDLKKLTGE